jgi:hypothetical protein
MTNKPDLDFTDSLITELLANMSLQDKVYVANLSEQSIHVLESTMENYVKHRLDLQPSKTREDVEEAAVILREVWKRLKETHKLRVVK